MRHPPTQRPLKSYPTTALQPPTNHHSPNSPSPKFTPSSFHPSPNSSLPPGRGEVRWGVGGRKQTTNAPPMPPPNLAANTPSPLSRLPHPQPSLLPSSALPSVIPTPHPSSLPPIRYPRAPFSVIPAQAGTTRQPPPNPHPHFPRILLPSPQQNIRITKGLPHVPPPHSDASRSAAPPSAASVLPSTPPARPEQP